MDRQADTGQHRIVLRQGIRYPSPASTEDPRQPDLPLEHGRLRLPTAYHSGEGVCGGFQDLRIQFTPHPDRRRPLRPATRGSYQHGHHPLLHASKTDVYPTNIERIEIAITNHTDLEGMGGEEYFIERFDGRAWKGIPQPTAFVALGYPIFPNQTRDDFSATLLPELKENPPGLYRVHKSVSTGHGAGLVHYPLTATFYLSDNPEDYEEYTRFASRLHEPRPMAEFKEEEKP